MAETMEGPERRPRHLDLVWAQRFLIAVRCQNAAAQRERSLRRIERLYEPCLEAYLRHRRAEIIKAMSKDTDVVDATEVEGTTGEAES